MGLDYSVGCVNFRDVGAWVNLIAGQTILPEGRLLRGGKIDAVTSAAEIGAPGSIINLRGTPDREGFGADLYHVPSRARDNYDTTDPEVRNWLMRVVGLFAAEDLRMPVLVHCLSGKDRTGIVVAALLRIADVPEKVILEEYLLSDGETHENDLQRSLDGIGKPERYFNRIDLARVQHYLRG